MRETFDPETPPLARGRQCGTFPQMTPSRNTPACAGKTNYRSAFRAARRKHPRLRGEDSKSAYSDASMRETPPLARGRLRSVYRLSPCLGNTPACAGKTTGGLQAEIRAQKHPRLRGEDETQKARRRVDLETPPLARGRLLLEINRGERKGNTPACAGKTSRGFPLGFFCRKHPRLRGEDIDAKTGKDRATETPPLARGRHNDSANTQTDLGNTPACAGKTILF